MAPPRIFILVNDAHYFGSIDAEEGGDIKLEARGTKALLSSWKPDDIALVWLENTNKPAAYFHILDIQPRADLVGQVEEYDETNERPHRVHLDSGTVIRMDLRKDTYKVVHKKGNRAVSEEKLSSPFDTPLPVRICWQVYKYTVQGNNIHYLKDTTGFPAYTPNADGFSLLEGEESIPYLKALKIDVDKGTPSAKRKLEYVGPGADIVEENSSSKKKKVEENSTSNKKTEKVTPKRSTRSSTPTPSSSTKTRSSAKKAPAKSPSSAKKASEKSPKVKKAAEKSTTPTPKSPTNAKKTPKKSPAASTSTRSPRKTPPEQVPLYTSPRKTKPPNYYSPDTSPSSTPKTPSSSSKSPKSVQFEKGTKAAAAASPGKRSSSRSRTPTKTAISVTTSPSPSAANSKHLAEGTVIAVRADSGKDFVVARVRKAFNAPTQGADRAHVKVTWLVEARESGLHGCFAAPNWPAVVSWGAVVKTHLNMRYDKEKDMYWLLDKHADIAALV